MHITSGVQEWTFNRSRQSTYATVSNPMFNDVRLVSHTQPFLDISKLAMLCIRDSIPPESWLLNVYQHLSSYKCKGLTSDSLDKFNISNKINTDKLI